MQLEGLSRMGLRGPSKAPFYPRMLAPVGLRQQGLTPSGAVNEAPGAWGRARSAMGNTPTLMGEDNEWWNG